MGRPLDFAQVQVYRITHITVVLINKAFRFAPVVDAVGVETAGPSLRKGHGHGFRLPAATGQSWSRSGAREHTVCCLF